MRFAILAALLSAMGGGKDPSVKSFRARDWLPIFEAEEKPRTKADTRKEVEVFRMVLRALAGQKLKQPVKGKGA